MAVFAKGDRVIALHNDECIGTVLREDKHAKDVYFVRWDNGHAGVYSACEIKLHGTLPAD